MLVVTSVALHRAWSAKEMGIDKMAYCKTISLNAIPLWLFCFPIVSIEIKDIVKCRRVYQNIQQYTETRYEDTIQMHSHFVRRTAEIMTFFKLCNEWRKLSLLRLCSDSMSSLSSIHSGKSICRQYIIDEINQSIFRITQQKKNYMVYLGSSTCVY